MRRPLVLLALVAAALAGVAACGSSSNGTASPPAAPVDRTGQSRVTIEAVNNQFVPKDVIVDAGTTVTWVNKDPHAHDVKKSADALDFGKPFGVGTSEFGPGQTYSFTFDAAGTYPYTCTIHALMDGSVKVVAKSSASTSSPAGSSTTSTSG